MFQLPGPWAGQEAHCTRPAWLGIPYSPQKALPRRLRRPMTSPCWPQLLDGSIQSTQPSESLEEEHVLRTLKAMGMHTCTRRPIRRTSDRRPPVAGKRVRTSECCDRDYTKEADPSGTSTLRTAPSRSRSTRGWSACTVRRHPRRSPAGS